MELSGPISWEVSDFILLSELRIYFSWTRGDCGKTNQHCFVEFILFNFSLNDLFFYRELKHQLTCFSLEIKDTKLDSDGGIVIFFLFGEENMCENISFSDIFEGFFFLWACWLAG